MSTFNKELDEITIELIESLIANEVYEQLEYKQQINIDERVEFLADLTAMANSDGGDIIYGVEESKGKPVSIKGIVVGSQDELAQQIENILRDSVSPRMQCNVKFIETKDNN